MTYKIFSQENAHPIVLYLLCNKLFESDWETWLFETIQSELKQYNITQKNLNKIMSMKTLHISDAPWSEWHLFNHLIHCLNGLPISHEMLSITEHPIPYIFNTVEIMNKVRKQDFESEVRTFISGCLLHENIQFAPTPIEFCQVYLSKPMYKCNDCGKIGSAMPPFNYICQSCGHIFSKDKPFNFKPGNDEGKNVDLYLEDDPTSIKNRYEQLSNEAEPYIEENEIDIQVAKLIIAKEYVSQQTKLLSNQLQELGLK